MSRLTMWLRAFPHWVPVAGVMTVVVFLAFAQCESRDDAVWKAEAEMWQDSAKVEQRRRAEAERQSAAARARSDTLAVHVHTLTRTADSAAQEARRAIGAASRARDARERAIIALARSGTQRDTIAALLSKSTADDSVIAAQSGALAAKSVEAVALRSALDSAMRARAVLTVALDSTTRQLARHGALVEQLQRVIATAPTSRRFSTVAVSLGVGACFAGSLAMQPCAGIIVGPSMRLF